MMAADVQGMGRIIMPRVDQFDSTSGRYHPHDDDQPTTSFTRSREDGEGRKFGFIQSWLDSPELSEEESRDSWSTLPKEWDTKIGLEEDLEARMEIEYARKADEAEEMEIRVGGKSISILKRRRQVIDSDEIRKSIVSSSSSSSLSMAPDHNVDNLAKRFKQEWTSASTESKKGKGRAARTHSTTTEDLISCSCSRGDDGEAMIRCDQCTGWYHLECLNMVKPPARKAIWNCFDCTTNSTAAARIPNSPLTRSPTKQVHFSTPVLSTSEPTLVATSLTPRPSGNFYHNSSSELLSLAPAPHSTPSQRVLIAPRTPIVPSSSSAHSIPSTPTFTRADYSPRSPLFYRSGRSRLISGTFDESIPLDVTSRGGGAGGTSWSVGDWDGQIFTSTPSSISRGSEASMHDAERSARKMVMEEDEFFAAPSWRDTTTTPSRSLSTMISSSTAGHSDWTVPVLTTPITSSNRRGVGGGNSKLNGGGGGGGTTASQEFLSNLHSLPHFGAAARSISHHLSMPTSPLGIGIGIGIKQRTRVLSSSSSSSNKLLSSPIARSGVHFNSPTLVPSHSSPRMRRKEIETTLPSPIFSSPESNTEDRGGQCMTRSGSGLGIGFDG